MTESRHKAFTLMELLVVIAIIGLLLSVAAPSLSRAKQQAQAVYCQSNLRQMMIAAVVYSENHGGFFPIAYYTQQAEGVMIQYNWDFTVRFPAQPEPAGSGLLAAEPPLPEPDPQAPSVAAGILWQGETAEKVQQCPVFRGSSNTAADPYTGYNYNTSYVGRGQREDVPEPARRDRLRNPASVAIFGDGESVEGANKFMRSPLRSEGDFSFNGRWAGTQGFRHLRRTNTAQGDGSTVSWAEVYTNVEPARYKKTLDDYNRLNPRSPVGFLSLDNSAYRTR